MTATAKESPAVRMLAWFMVAVISLPAIVWGGIIGGDPDWRYQVPSTLGLALALVLLGRWSVFKPLRSFTIVWLAQLVAFIVLFGTLDVFGYFDWLEGLPAYQARPIQSTMFLVPAAAALLAAAALGYHRDDLYLRAGHSGALGAVPGMRRSVSWTRLGLITIAVAAAGGVIFVATTDDPTRAGFALFVRWLPLGLLFAAINAIQEEVRFRSAVLVTLVPGVGAESAIWMTAAIFGLAHWFQSTPSGPLGAVLSGLIGAWLAKSMLETDGIAWPWIIHVVLDIIVFATLTVGTT